MRFLGVVIIVLIAMIVLGLLIYAGQQTAKVLRRRADRKVPWTPYSEVSGDELEIGVERRTEDGQTLSKVHMHTIPAGADLDRHIALQEARFRARQYNEDKVGM